MSSAVLSFRRAELEARIEYLIELLDALDGDSDLEPYLAGEQWLNNRGGSPDDREGDLDEDEGDNNCDDEPMLGARENHPRPWGMSGRSNEGGQDDWYRPTAFDECEEENEHGGDILDVPHDLDSDLEETLGWSNPMGLRVHVPEEAAQLMAGIDDGEGGPLGFDGRGTQLAKHMLKQGGGTYSLDADLRALRAKAAEMRSEEGRVYEYSAEPGSLFLRISRQ